MNIGDIVGGYEILEHLDDGGMGTVYKVKRGEEEYALKTCLGSDDESIKRFNREIRLMQSIQHDNVISVFDTFIDKGIPILIMPLCEKSLGKAVSERLTPDLKFEYVKQFCLGLKAIHDGGGIHRDIKPNNALLLNGKVLVSDLGLGKFVIRDSTVITGEKAYMGSHGYMPPEIYRDLKGKDADERSDIYSIGCLIYYVFTDGLPPTHIDPTEISADIYGIVNKCTKLSPSDRYQNVSDIIRDLNICEQSRKMPLDLKDTISTYRRGVNDRQFYDTIYAHLLTLQDDFGRLINDLREIGEQYFAELLKYKKDKVNNLINLLLNAYNNKDNYGYWVQFSDIEVLVGRAKLLMKATNSLHEKQELLDFSIKISVLYTRFPAMKIVGDMFNDLSSEEIKMMSVFFTKNKENINIMRETVNLSLPQAIQSLVG